MQQSQLVSPNRQLLPCPRCIGGKLVDDWYDGLVCVNCGYTPRLPVPALSRHGPVLKGSR